jgi:hypothetical protein
MHLVESASPTGNWFAEAVGTEEKCRGEVERLAHEFIDKCQGSFKWTVSTGIVTEALCFDHKGDEVLVRYRYRKIRLLK